MAKQEYIDKNRRWPSFMASVLLTVKIIPIPYIAGMSRSSYAIKLSRRSRTAPVLGGFVSEHFQWKGVFVFLSIFSVALPAPKNKALNPIIRPNSVWLYPKWVCIMNGADEIA